MTGSLPRTLVVASALAVLTSAPALVAAQTRSFPDVPVANRLGPDSARAAALEATGERYERERAVLLVPAGAIPRAHGSALADTLDRIVAAVEQVVGGPHPWQRWHRPRVRFYAPDAVMMAHANDGARVFIPLRRLAEGTAPLIHETVHALLEPLRDSILSSITPSITRENFARILSAHPYWLQEGIADAIALDVGQQLGRPDFDVFEDGPLTAPGPRCRRWLDDERARSVLRFIGTSGRPPALMTDRENVAPPFYVCSHSYTRFLIERHGLPAVAALLNANDTGAAVARLERRSVEESRAAWLAAIGR